MHEPRPGLSGNGAPGEAVRRLVDSSVQLMFAQNRTRMVLSGEVDAALSRELDEAICAAVRSGSPVEVDTRRVTFMDSSGIAKLAQLARDTGRPAIIEPPDIVRFLLEVTRIGEAVDIVDTDPGFPEGPPPDAPNAI